MANDIGIKTVIANPPFFGGSATAAIRRAGPSIKMKMTAGLSFRSDLKDVVFTRNENDTAFVPRWRGIQGVDC